jgi:exopolyphosphatase/guanosine-5'-triphosphate,3'-diphosphate pyrophosphatase
MKNIAILDLGTNTFNLLIAEICNQGSFKTLVNRKLAVKLGEGSINKGEIISSAYNRGIDAIRNHFNLIQKYNVKKVEAFGTSALRTAKNGKDFLAQIKEETGIEIQIISGDKEAELIYFGVRNTLNLSGEKFVILDIGGGSNEFIIADMNKILWKKSYPLGIARLLDKYHPSDPIKNEEITKINKFLAGNLLDLFDHLVKYQINTLVGASGSFETFVTIIKQLDVNETECVLKDNSNEISIQDFLLLHERLIASTLNERRNMKGLEPMRIEMIVLASLFVNFILENHSFQRIIQSNYALKEGAVYEHIKEL